MDNYEWVFPHPHCKAMVTSIRTAHSSVHTHLLAHCGPHITCALSTDYTRHPAHCRHSRHCNTYTSLSTNVYREGDDSTLDLHNHQSPQHIRHVRYIHTSAHSSRAGTTLLIRWAQLHSQLANSLLDNLARALLAVLSLGFLLLLRALRHHGRHGRHAALLLLLLSREQHASRISSL